MTAWHAVAAADAVSEDEPLAVSLGGLPIALFRQGDDVFALHDLCTHGAARLSEGFVENGCVECPLHQGCFDLASGLAITPPVTESVRTFPVRVVAGQIEIEA